MLSVLLVDRFKLAYRIESKNGRIYALERASDRHALRAAGSPGRPFVAGLLGGPDGSVFGGDATMPFLSAQISSVLERPVFDRTGLDGAFNFRCDRIYDPQETNPASIVGPFLKCVGLKLVPSTGPAKFVIVERLERPLDN